ncbi:uncharacterized protein C2845_PM15G00890 [Panicum miliaceum]|uniref:Ubiquitin-like protease family profile domain-containing protein n=1 Tax=Panicum miliaceum TaxID=4540 RepID=A0A3L6Q706_PANMI|nr:uncharacterized protein C2845_PM15G00890 [Panicum miliaceum]
MPPPSREAAALVVGRSHAAAWLLAAAREAAAPGHRPQLAGVARPARRLAPHAPCPKIAAGKKKEPKSKAGGKNKRVKLQLAKAEQQRRDEHEKILTQLRQVADEDISKLKSSIPGEACPTTPSCALSFLEDPIDDIKSQTPPIRLSQEEREQGSRPNIPLSKALALRNKIVADEKLKETTLIDYTTYISFDGSKLITTFADDKDDDSSILDFTVHCLRYDDIVHKEDSIRYRVFLSTAFYIQLKEVESIYMDDEQTETEQFNLLWRHLECEVEHYSDITKAKLIFIPVCAQRHYFVYCINLIHQHIDILDSIDYFWTVTSPDTRHEPIKNKLPFMNAAFQKVSGNKFPQIDKWSTTMINLPKQAGPSDCMFFLCKYMEFWDGERLYTNINPGMIYRVELMHYLMFHPLNQADLPDVTSDI